MGRIGLSGLLGTLVEAVQRVHIALRVKLGVGSILGVFGGCQEHGRAIEGIHAATLPTGLTTTVALAALPSVPAVRAPATATLAGNYARKLRERGIQRTHLRLDTGRRIQQVICATRRNKRRQIATGLCEQGAVHGECGTGTTSTLLLPAMTVRAAMLVAATMRLAIAAVMTGHSLQWGPILLWESPDYELFRRDAH